MHRRKGQADPLELAFKDPANVRLPWQCHEITLAKVAQRDVIGPRQRMRGGQKRDECVVQRGLADKLRHVLFGQRPYAKIGAPVQNMPDAKVRRPVKNPDTHMRVALRKGLEHARQHQRPDRRHAGHHQPPSLQRHMVAQLSDPGLDFVQCAAGARQKVLTLLRQYDLPRRAMKQRNAEHRLQIADVAA